VFGAKEPAVDHLEAVDEPISVALVLIDEGETQAAT